MLCTHATRTGFLGADGRVVTITRMCVWVSRWVLAKVSFVRKHLRTWRVGLRGLGRQREALGPAVGRV